jgi:hypothetical protein
MGLSAGNFGQCEGPMASSRADGGSFSNDREACHTAGYAWTAERNNFDDLGTAVITMFIIFVGENGN